MRTEARCVISLASIAIVAASSIFVVSGGASAEVESEPLPTGPTIPVEEWPSEGVRTADGEIADPLAAETSAEDSSGECGVPEGENATEVCFTISTAEPDDIAMGAAPAPEARSAAPVDIPSECIEQALAGGIDQPGGVQDLDRFSSCTISTGDVQIRRSIRGVSTVVGQMQVLIYNYAYSVFDLRVWANQIEVQPTVVSGAAAGATFRMQPACAGDACDRAGKTAPAQAPALGDVATGESFWKWTGSLPKSQARGVGSWTINVQSGRASSNPATVVNRPVRCDNVIKPAGCIFPEATPVIYYYTGNYPTLAQHIFAAQLSGLPGSQFLGERVPLHRLQDPLVRNANRATACPQNRDGGPRRPAGYSCDEYPFASTAEGAAASGPAAGRTFDFCQYPGLPVGSIGPIGWSACMVPEAENSNAGSVLESTLFRPFRVIDGDAFWVDITVPG